MKTLRIFTASALVFVLICLLSFTYPQDIAIQYGTVVVVELTGMVTLDDKPGTPVAMKVQKDVIVNGVVVIAKDAPVYATIRVNQKPKVNAYTGEEKLGELLIDIFSTKAIDGSEIKFADVYMQYFAEKNYNMFDKKRKWLIGEGSIKNCETRVKYTVHIP
ncbi:MAG: hypothetical protein U0T74_15255 [Chitinophagales bacterium]